MIEEKYKIRFLNRIKKSKTCWLWQGSIIRSNGYGQMNYQQTDNLVHRLAWKIYKGKIPYKLQVLHKCDIPSCVNPSHLYLGNQSRNLKDCVNRKRHPWAKLNIRIAKKIRNEYSKGNTSIRKLASKYGIAHSGMFRLIKGVYYND